MPALQNVDYTYNIRGWLKTINDVNNIGTVDLFAFKLGYNEGTSPLYNGNISLTQWKTRNTDSSLKTYNYTYDALNRIKTAINTNANYNLDLVNYDKNGNIMALKRKGHTNATATTFGMMDDLTYNYDAGNKLTKVEDIASLEGFKNGANITTEYTYDQNGNMLTDANKGITNITYNHLNLPTQVFINNPEHIGNISYIYDASGAKLKKITTEGSSLITTEYAGNYVYENGTLQFFNTAEGYVEPNGTGWQYVYQYRDHLGNVRLSYTDSNGDGAISPTTEILSEKNYYPFGLLQKGYNNVVSSNANFTAEKFQYNGKEIEEDLGLGWIDYGARRYMRDLGRWASKDPYAEMYETTSPYTYVSNNPVNAIDPDGRLIIYVNGLFFGQALNHKTTGYNEGKFVGNYAYPPPRNFQRNGISMFGQPAPYWGEVRTTINKHFNDKNNIFINATDDFKSQASDRFAQGMVSGLELIANLRDGTIKLENEETIKVVGHSQGAAFAAGLLTVLANSEYASRVELGLYLSPHQPGDFKHPVNIPGVQLSTLSDWVSSGADIPYSFLFGLAGIPLLKSIMNELNGGSEFSKIEGVDFLFIRRNHDGGKGGHDVGTWNTILSEISGFLKNNNVQNKNQGQGKGGRSTIIFWGFN